MVGNNFFPASSSDAVVRSGMDKIRIRDKHSESATLLVRRRSNSGVPVEVFARAEWGWAGTGRRRRGESSSLLSSLLTQPRQQNIGTVAERISN